MAVKIRKIREIERKSPNPRCDRCLDELEAGQGYYHLAGIIFCRRCLPQVAEALFMPWLQISGEEVGAR